MAFFAKNIAVATQVKRIAKQLNAVVEKSQDQVEDTLIIQASLLGSEIKANAPVDSTSDTPGALRDSVRVERAPPKGKKAVIIKIKAGNDATLKQGKSGKAYNYARAVEFGTQDAPAKPFFFPLYRARRKEIRGATRKAIAKAVKGAFR